MHERLVRSQNLRVPTPLYRGFQLALILIAGITQFYPKRRNGSNVFRLWRYKRLRMCFI